MNRVSIGFTGDFSFSGYFDKAYLNEDIFSPEIIEFFDNNDANIINQESPITECRYTKKKRLAHRSDPNVIPYVQKNILNPIFSLANNHMMDYNRIGLIDTIDNLNKEKATFIGAGKEINEASKYVIVGDEIKVAIIAIQYKKFRIAGKRFAGPFQESREAYLKERISYLRSIEKVDWIVLIYHGGDEFLFAPMPYTRKLLHSYLDMGVDVVVGHHPHVVQGFEKMGNKAIFYSLGNFMFDTDYQRVQEGTTEGMLLRINFEKDSFVFENFPVSIDRDKQCVLKGDYNKYFIDYYANKLLYKKLWPREAMRKIEVLNYAKALRETVVNQQLELSNKEELRVEQLKMSYMLKCAQEENDDDMSAQERADMDEETFDDNNESFISDAEAVSVKKVGWNNIVRYFKRKSKKNINRRALTLKYGRLKYKLFYRKSDVFN